MIRAVRRDSPSRRRDRRTRRSYGGSLFFPAVKQEEKPDGYDDNQQ
jgi:hypothetical protein